ncbi:MAG TPA: ABC transporter permease [Vitreimonas sp.]|nr:ABC transporter permease [Vitreimonas sp.]
MIGARTSAPSFRLPLPRHLGDRLLRVYGGLVYLFLFAPIVIVVVFSFNAGRHATEMTGFSPRWYEIAWTNPFVLRALRNSLTIAAASALLATVFGTLSALALQRIGGRTRSVFEQLTNMAIIVPGIVIGIATLIFLVTLFGWLNPWLAFFMNRPPRLGLGAHTVIAAHTLFTMAIVNVLVRTRLKAIDRTLIEASEDLYATPLRTFRQITLPQLAPAIMAGALLAFTFSFDDFIVAFFTSGQDQTLPIYLFASIRRGVTPEVNAIASVLLALTVSLMALAWFLLLRRDRAARRARAA